MPAVPSPAARLRSLLSRARPLGRDERGLSTTEYIIILALICIVGFGLWQQFGSHASDRNRAAAHVVNGLATTSSEGDHHDGASGSARGGAAPAASGSAAAATSGSAYPDLRDESAVGSEPEESDVWKFFVVAGVFFGGMILWLTKQKSSR